MTAPRRLLHVFATFGRGGPQVRSTQLMGRLGSGFSHRVLAMDGRVEAASLLADGAPVELLPAPAGRGFVASVRAFAALLRAEQPDLVLTYNWGAIEAVAGARRAGVPVVHHEEGFGPQEWQRRLRRRNWIRRVVLRRLPVIVPSQHLQRIARAEWGLREPWLRYLPNGVDCARFAPTTAPRPTRPFTIGSVGGLRAEKDHATLLRAFAAMRRQDARLLLVGDGPERPRLAELAGALRVADRVVFAGSTDDVASSYQAMDCFCLPSRTEQMPLSLLEAMASGLPAVGTDVGDVRVMLPEECRQGLVAAGDVPALARALDEVAGDPARRAAEGAANRQRAVARYELGECLQRYHDAYLAAMGRPG